MLTVITEGMFGSRFEADRSRGVVVVESDKLLKNGSFGDAIAELDSMEARHRALGYANTVGVADARINGSTSGAYPVNAEGVPLEFIRDEMGQPVPLTDPKMRVARYRTDVPVTKRLV